MKRHFLTILLVAGSAVYAGNPADQLTRQGASRTDLHGDPLPDGAIARLGSIRLRHAGLSDFVFVDGGKTILSAGSDRALRFWDVAAGRQSRAVRLQGSAGPGWLVTLSPNGKTLAAHDKDKLVFWDTDTGKEVKTLPMRGVRVGYLHFSPDGRTLAVGRADWKISFWDWKAQSERVTAMSVGPSGRRSGIDGTFHGSFSPDGKWFVAGAFWPEPLGIFEVATAREVRRLQCNPGTSAVCPQSRHIAVCSMLTNANGGGTGQDVLRLFDLPSGKQLAEFPGEYWHDLVFSPDGKTLAFCGSLMDLQTGRIVQRLKVSWWQQPRFSPDGKLLAAKFYTRLRIWDVSTGKEWHDKPGDFHSYPATVGKREPVTAVSPDGKLFAAVGAHDSAISLWDTIAGRLVRHLPLEDSVTDVAFLADGKSLACCQYCGGIRFFDVTTGKQERALRLQYHDAPDSSYFTQICLSPNGKRVSTLGWSPIAQVKSTRLCVWDASTGRLIRQEILPGEASDGRGYNRRGWWSDDGLAVALPTANSLALLDALTGVPRYQIAGVSKDPVAGIQDDRLMAAVRTDGNAIGVWEIATGREVAVVPTGRVAHFALFPDHRCLITADAEFLRLWDMATAKELHRWPLPVAGTDSWGRTFVLALDLCPDGRRAITVLADGTALIWDLSSALAGRRPLTKEWSEKQIAAWWEELADQDAARAYAAIWRLEESGGRAVTLLDKRVTPVTDSDFEKVRRLVQDLDSETFKVRENAARELEALGSPAVPALRAASAKKQSLEAQWRIQRILSRPHVFLHPPETLRQLRTVTVLEQIDSQESRRLLGKLAKGAAEAVQTREATRALERLSRWGRER